MRYLIYRIDVNIHGVVIINTDRTVELEKKKKKLPFNDGICIFKQIAAFTELFFVDAPGPPYSPRWRSPHKQNVPPCQTDSFPSVVEAHLKHSLGFVKHSAISRRRVLSHSAA